MGLANVYVAMKIGVQNYESSIAGLGGCPFTKVTAGNVCTEDFVHALQRMGFREEINLTKLIDLAKEFSGFFKRDMPGLVYKAGVLDY